MELALHREDFVMGYETAHDVSEKTTRTSSDPEKKVNGNSKKNVLDTWILKTRQKLDFKYKLAMSRLRIKAWYEHYNGDVHVSFSGGKDSTVLLHMVREMYPEVPGVFVDTGLEYPEIRSFVKQFDNITFLKPKMPFHKVVEKYGWPVVSKRIAQYVREITTRTGKNEATRKLRLTGIGPDGRYRPWGRIPPKWHKLLDAPFKVSEKCCDVMKKAPFRQYEKETGGVPFVGMMAAESRNRQLLYLRNGCNAFDLKRPMSTPMAFWLNQDVFEYLTQHELPIAEVYGQIRQDLSCRYYTTGVRSTGCMFCAFGVHLEHEPNRFQLMKRTHPKIWKYVIDKLGMREVLDFIEVPYE